MRFLGPLLVAVSLGACMPMQGDEQACRHAAAREAGYNSYWYQQRMQPVVVAPGQVILPSAAFVDPYAQRFLDESRLAQLCMESKGYRLKK